MRLPPDEKEKVERELLRKYAAGEKDPTVHLLSELLTVTTEIRALLYALTQD